MGRKKITLWVDADSCPAEIRRRVEIEVKPYADSLSVFFCADRPLPIRNDPIVSFRLIPKGKESVDNHILSRMAKGDLVLTRDFLFARQVLDRGGRAMNFDGKVFTDSWLDKRIEERNLMEVLYSSGSVKRYKKKERAPSQNNNFSLSFSSTLKEIIMRQGDKS